jgi:hypothetical protein
MMLDRAASSHSHWTANLSRPIRAMLPTTRTSFITTITPVPVVAGGNAREPHARERKAKHGGIEYELPMRSSARSLDFRRLADRYLVARCIRAQAMARMTILYQLQNRHSALESLSLVGSSTTKAQNTATTVKTRYTRKVLTSDHWIRGTFRSSLLPSAGIFDLWA